MERIFHTTTLLIIISSATLCHGQRLKQDKIYYTWVYKDSARQPVKGFLHHLSDSSLWIRNGYKTPVHREIMLRNVQALKFRRNGNVGKGIGIGALLGFTVGGVVGLFIDQCNYLPCSGGGNISIINPNPGPTRSPRGEGFVVLGIISTIP